MRRFAFSYYTGMLLLALLLAVSFLRHFPFSFLEALELAVLVVLTLAIAFAVWIAWRAPNGPSK